MVRARLFGPLTVEADGRPMPELGLRPRALFAYLLLHPGRHARAGLAPRFWPDVLDTSARASLRSALWAVRAGLDAIGAGEAIAGDRASVGLVRDAGWDVDAARFAELEAAGGPDDLAAAFELAAEPLLADLADEWVLVERDAWRDRACAVALRLAGDAEAEGDHRGAVLWTRRALARDRANEALHRELVRRLVAAGEPADALAAYERCRAVLAAEFAIAPAPATRALVAELRRPPGVAVAPAAAAAPPPAAPRLVGRDAELEALLAAWRRPDAGLRLALVQGAAGLGKTRLLAELGERARRDGGLVLTAAPAAEIGGTPLGAWAELVAALVRALPAPDPALTWPAALARLSPAVETAWGRTPTATEATPELARLRLFEAVERGLAWAAARAPLLVAIDDAHGIDPASAALLTHVGRRLQAEPVLVVATRRAEAPAAALDVALETLERAGVPSTTLTLAPLPEAALDAVVRGVAPGIGEAERERAVALADGSPLLAREAGRALAAGDEPTEGLRVWLRGPLARLSDPSRLLVDVVAAAARPLTAAEAADVVGAEQLAGAVDEAVAAGLLAERPDRRLGFTHALVRDAVYAELAPGRRVWAHARLAAALVARPRHGTAEVGRHLLLAGEPDRALPQLVAAARSARALGAIETATGLLREAAELAGASPRAAAELWLELAGLEAQRGRRAAYDEAFGHAVAVLEEAGDADGLVGAWAGRGRDLGTVLCYPAEAYAAYSRALDLLDAGVEAPEVRVLADVGEAWMESAIGDVGRGVALSTALAASPDVAADPTLAVVVAVIHGIACLRQGRETEGIDVLLAAVERPAILRHSPTTAMLAFNIAASAAATRGEDEAVLGLMDRALASCGRAGIYQRVTATTARAYALSRLGRHPEALEAGRDSLAAAAASGDADLIDVARFDLGSLLLVADRPDEAAAELEIALAGPVTRFPRTTARLRAAEARLAAGDPAAARAQLEAVPFERSTPSDLRGTLVPSLDRIEGLIAAAEGRPERAAALLASAAEGFRRLAGPDRGSEYAAHVVDLGRPPVAGLVDPLAEAERADAERAALAHATTIREGS